MFLKSIFRGYLNCKCSNSINFVDAGVYDPICSRKQILMGNTIVAGETGFWTAINTTATFDNPSLNNTTVWNLAPGDNELAWTISNGVCSDSDTAHIFNSQPYVNAGPDDELCDGSYILQGNEPSRGTWGTWTLISGEGGLTIVDPNLWNTEINSFGAGPFKLLWYLFNAGEECPSRDTVVLINNMVTANTYADQLLCDTIATIGANLPPAGAFGEWVPINTSAYFYITPTSNISACSLDFGVNEFEWVITKGLCIARDTMSVYRLEMPYAGVDQTFFSNDYPNRKETTILNADEVSEHGVGKWTVVKGSAIVDNPLYAKTSVHDLLHGENIFRWTVMAPAPGCAESDDVSIVSGFSFMPAETVLNWFDPADWINGVVPGPGDSVTIVNTNASIVGDTASVYSISIEAGGSLTIGCSGGVGGVGGALGDVDQMAVGGNEGGVMKDLKLSAIGTVKVCGSLITKVLHLIIV